MKSNCYDIESVYFEMDKARKGYVDRFDFKLFIINNSASGQEPRFGVINEEDLDYIMYYFDSKSNGRIEFKDCLAFSSFSGKNDFMKSSKFILLLLEANKEQNNLQP